MYSSEREKLAYLEKNAHGEEGEPNIGDGQAS